LEAEQALERFSERWDDKYPAITPSWRADWQRLTVFFDYPREIRKIVYTTNAIESLNYSMRKVLKNRGAFPNDESIMKLMFMGLKNVANKWTRPIRDWKAALNQFVILYGDRVLNYIQLHRLLDTLIRALVQSGVRVYAFAPDTREAVIMHGAQPVDYSLKRT